jgi:hypothetical protein
MRSCTLAVVTLRATPRAENITSNTTYCTIHLTTLQDATLQTGSTHAAKTAPPAPREMDWPLSYQQLTVWAGATALVAHNFTCWSKQLQLLAGHIPDSYSVSPCSNPVAEVMCVVRHFLREYVRTLLQMGLLPLLCIFLPIYYCKLSLIQINWGIISR